MHRFALAAHWSEWPLVARRALVAAVVLALIVTGIATDVLRRTSDLYVVVAAILVLLLARSTRPRTSRGNAFSSRSSASVPAASSSATNMSETVTAIAIAKESNGVWPPRSTW